MESNNVGKECLVLPTASLEDFKFTSSNGYSYRRFETFLDLRRFVRTVRECAEYRERFGENGVETDPSFQQLVMYSFVLTNDGRFLLYKRAGEESYDEPRLTEKFSVGIGGHVEPTDRNLAHTFYREFGEEAELFSRSKNEPISFTNEEGKISISELKKHIQLHLVGLLKDERDEAGTVHLAIVCKAAPKEEDLEVRIKVGQGQENTTYEYITPQEYTRKYLNKEATSPRVTVEGWTDIVLQEEIFRLLQSTPSRDLCSVVGD